MGRHAIIPSDSALTLSADGRHILTLAKHPKATKKANGMTEHHINFHLRDVTTDTVISRCAVIITDGDQPPAIHINAVALSPDALRALTASLDGRIRLWGTATGYIIMTTSNKHKFFTFGITFSADGTHALSGSRDRTARLWNLNNGDVITTFTGHTDDVTAVALSPDGRRALTGSRDNTLRLWDLDTARCRACFFAESPITACTFADGGILVAGDQNGRLHFLDLIE